MKSVEVKFTSINQIVQFVNIVEHYDSDIDLRHGRIVVDAKSLLGVLSLGIEKRLKLQVLDETCNDLLEKVDFCMVA